MTTEEFRRKHGHDSKGLGGRVEDGDAVHKQHSHMVGACGTWLQGKVAPTGGLVYATYTGRPTGKGTYGTPGVPDLAGWAVCPVTIGSNITFPPWMNLHETTTPVPLHVECKVAGDTLSPAQVEFRKMAEAAGCLYFEARWDGENPDEAADDLKRQWAEATTKGADE